MLVKTKVCGISLFFPEPVTTAPAGEEILSPDREFRSNVITNGSPTLTFSGSKSNDSSGAGRGGKQSSTGRVQKTGVVRTSGNVAHDKNGVPFEETAIEPVDPSSLPGGKWTQRDFHAVNVKYSCAVSHDGFVSSGTAYEKKSERIRW